jgi:hypothetical protein
MKSMCPKVSSSHRAFTRLGLAVLLSLSLCAVAQQATVPTVVFTCDFPGSSPSHYEISVGSDGQGSYSSQTKPGSPADGESGTDAAIPSTDAYRATFALSSSTIAHIFDLAKRANYFTGVIDSKKKTASTGSKTLAFHSPDHNGQTTYNYSKLAPVEDLTAIFQGLSETMEFVHRLDYDLQYQKLALDEELKRMEDLASRGALQGLSVASPVLEKIADDAAIMNVSRARAQRLLSAADAKK